MTRSSVRRRTVAAITGGVVLLGAATVTASVLIPAPSTTTAAARPAASATSTSAPLAAPTTAATPVPSLTTKTMTPATATQAVAGYVKVVDALTPKSDVAAFTGLISGKALDEVKAQALEFKSNGWTVTGATKVSDVTVVKRSTQDRRATAVVRACIDSSKVVVRTAAGKPAFPGASGTRRALNLYTMQYQDGSWRVISHTFPESTAC